MKALIDRYNKKRNSRTGQWTRAKAWFDKLTTLSEVEGQSTPSSEVVMSTEGRNLS
jgi:hypothetical protein